MIPVHNDKSLIHRAVIISDSQKAITEFIRSRNEKGTIKKYPEWDVARAGPAAELVKTRRELNSADVALKIKREEQHTKRKIMDQQWDELKSKEKLLRQSFIKFNKFVKENYEKRDRAEHKINEEYERQMKRLEDAEDSANKLNHMKEIRDNMQQHIKKYKIYQTFLERVVSETGQFQSIADIFNRYETLVEAKEALSENQDKKLQVLETTGTEMYHMTEVKSQILMGLNNKLAEIQGKFDRAKAEALKWETIVSQIKAAAAAKNLELTQVNFCSWNMYQQICKRKGLLVEVSREDAEQQLVHVKRTILELKRITKVAAKKAFREDKGATTK
ncbi:coiled-coil domain-containing protein 42 like-2 [Orussus abietinus]|uniref:coiled-coil domain-containing protein 42 like-2 n=1 Tax=Orussus abietinus TaxID=222816 RepID=UPI000C715C8C|nr:coiled-coil domain-containing protein 42 like-2 [Orussus abietinus]